MGVRLIQGDEDRWWRELQLAASASAGGRAANFGLFFNGVPMSLRLIQVDHPSFTVGARYGQDRVPDRQNRGLDQFRRFCRPISGGGAGFVWYFDERATRDD